MTHVDKHEHEHKHEHEEDINLFDVREVEASHEPEDDIYFGKNIDPNDTLQNAGPRYLVIAFCFPPAGLYFWFLDRVDYPRNAKKYLSAAFTGTIFILVLLFLLGFFSVKEIPLDVEP